MKILLVDDSKAMRLIVRRTLREAGFDQHEYVEKQNGKEALEALQASRFDMVLAENFRKILGPHLGGS